MEMSGASEVNTLDTDFTYSKSSPVVALLHVKNVTTSDMSRFKNYSIKYQRAISYNPTKT